MRQTLSRFLLRFLILAVFFNTAFALPLHQLGHLTGALEHLQEVSASAETGADETSQVADAHHHQHETEAEAVCTWCVALAQAGLGITQAGTTFALLNFASAAIRQTTGEPVHNTHERWPFSPRGPPAAA
jgi:Protein of unknown function (DUF2946)